MKFRVLALMAAAVLVVGLLAVPGLATYTSTDSGDTSNSEAEISVVDCVVESTKDISYISFQSSGEELERDESIDEPTFDLSGYEHLDDVTSIAVKSGQTVESFGVTDCQEDTTTDGDDTTKDDDTSGDHDDDTKDDDVTQPDEVKSHNDKAGANSQATITLSGCTLNSSKDISYIAFLSDGSQVDKIEGVDAESYNLDNYAGIDDVDQVRVKAGTTVATFSVNCGDATDSGDTHDEAKDDDTDTDDQATEDEHDDDSTDNDDAWDDHDDDVKDEDSDDDQDDSDDDAETDGEWDARHDGRHDHKDHEEIDHEDS